MHPLQNLLEIDILREDKRWNILSDETIHTCVDHIFKHLSQKQSYEISILLADDVKIQQLNKTYRGKDKPTNVLSFPAEEDNAGMLGDVILAYDTIQRESAEQNKTFEDHCKHLLVHGILHLLGYDHEEDAEAEEMENTEITILKTLGVKNPYKAF